MNTPLFPDLSSFLREDSRKTRWAIPYHAECLNARVQVLLSQNSDALKDQTVFDTASHIGTFSYAAHKLGARHVTGVDSEARTIETAKKLFQEEGIDGEAYRFETRDVFSFLEEAGENSFDTVLCFGMLYYTAEPYRLLRLMCRAAKKHVLIDTFTAPYAALTGKDAADILPNVTDATWRLPTLITTLTQSAKKDYELPESFLHKGNPVSLTAFPTESLLELWFASLGATHRKLDWSAFIARECTWRDLMTPDQKKSSHWTDVYSANVRAAYRLDL